MRVVYDNMLYTINYILCIGIILKINIRYLRMNVKQKHIVLRPHIPVGSLSSPSHTQVTTSARFRLT